METSKIVERAKVYRNGTDTGDAAAAMMVKVAPLLVRVYGMVEDSGERGITCDETVVALGRSHQTISARFCDLRERGLIKDSGNRRPTRSGRGARVYVLADE